MSRNTLARRDGRNQQKDEQSKKTPRRFLMERRMRAIGGLAIAVALGAIGCLSGGAAAQQTLSLPDVTVTAPANIPPSTAAGNPYFGKTRVEETSWPSIPCT